MLGFGWALGIRFQGFGFRAHGFGSTGFRAECIGLRSQ